MQGRWKWLYLNLPITSVRSVGSATKSRQSVIHLTTDIAVI